MTRRRGPLLGSMLLLACLGLAGCAEDASRASGPTPAPSGAGSSGSFPVTVAHKFGETTVPEEPERVVSVGLTEQDVLLQLGVVPVAVTEWYGEQPSATWPWAQDLLDGAEPEVLSTADGFEFERIATLEPDLIIGTNAGMTKRVGSQAVISAENVDLIDADVIVFATESDDMFAELQRFGTIGSLSAVAQNRTVYTDEVLAGAIYFLTPLSLTYVLEELGPQLEEAAVGNAPRAFPA